MVRGANKRVTVRRPAFVLVLTATLVACVDTSPAGTTNGQEARPQDDSKSEQLATAANKLVHAIKNRDDSTVLSMFSTRGIIMGVDGPRVPLSQLRQEFRKRRGAYCFFFDTACLRKEEQIQRQKLGLPLTDVPVFSLADVFSRVGNLRVKALLVGTESKAGHVSVVWEGEPTEYFVGGFPEFLFQLDGGEWKLVAVPYM